MDGLRHFVHRLVHPKIWLALGIVSVVAFVATAFFVPFALVRLSKDYFVRPPVAKRQPLALRLLKDALGVVLVLMGIAMLVLPGQGLITIVLGLGLVDFPGRRKLELWVIRRPGVLRGVNALRQRFGRERLELPHRD